jgi:hypothetical protein
MTTTHAFYESEPKLLARAENVRLYRELAGVCAIPAGKQYWCLCAEQRDTPESEINQLVGVGLLGKEQFVGVDRDPGVIEKNRTVHPEATWLCGEWEDVVSTVEPFNPGLIYLDTESLAGRVTLNMAATTMKLCSPGTVLLLNVMQSSRYRDPMESAAFISSLAHRIPNPDEWVPTGGVKNYDYASCSTLMQTYAFMRRAS